MSKFFLIIKILVSLFSLKYFQCKKCPSLSMTTNALYDEGYYIISFFQIPFTNLLLINTINDSTYSSIVYYHDVSSIQGDTIDIVQSDYFILDMSYNYHEHKLLVFNRDRIITANPYTLKSERSLSMPNLINAKMLEKTKYAIATLKQYVINIIDTENMVVVKSLNNKFFPNVVNTTNYYTRYFSNPSYDWIFITVNSYGFYSWSVNLDPFVTKYNGYIGPTIVNSTDYAYRQFTKHSTKDIFFVGGSRLEILAFEIVDINTQTYRTQIKLNLYDSKYGDNATNIFFISNSKYDSKPMLIVGDGYDVFDLILEFDEVNKVYTIPSYKNPKYTWDYKTQFVWYQDTDETKKIFYQSGTYKPGPNLPTQSYVTLYNYWDRTFDYTLFFGNERKIRRYLYEGVENFFVIQRTNSLMYYNKTNIATFISKFATTYDTYIEDNNWYRVKNCKECLIVKEARNETHDHVIQYVLMYPRDNNLNFSMSISSLGYKWSDINMNLDPFQYKGQVWVVFGFRNKALNEKFLFVMINMHNSTQNVYLSAATDEENSHQSRFAVASVDDPDNIEIIGVDQLGYIYVWDFLNPKVIKYSIKPSLSCMNSVIGTIFQQNKNKWLIYVCDDLKVLSYDFEKKTTSLIRYVASTPLSLRSFPSLGIIVIGDTILGNSYIYKFKNGIFTYFLTIQPGSLKETVIYIELLQDNIIWIQFEQSNLFYSLVDCIDDANNCQNCEQSNSFNIFNSNVIGNGQPENPYTSTFNFLTSIMQSKRYQHRISGISSMNVEIIIDPQSKQQMVLPQEYLNFDFSSIISLTLKSKIENQLALLEYIDILEFTNYYYVRIKDIKIQYKLEQIPNECGIKFNNIAQNATLNNILLNNIDSLNKQLNCYKISADQTILQIQKLEIKNQDFSFHTSIFSTLYSDNIYIQNLSLDNCTLGDNFSILTQNSNLVASLKSVSLVNNICTHDRTNQVSSLFSAGLFSIENLKISNNNFCNKIIFSSVPSLKQQDYEFQFKQVEILDNKFIARTSYLFFNSLYSMKQDPSHSVIFQQINVSNNTLLKINEKDLMSVSLIQTSKIMNHVFNDITFKNHNELSFCSIEYSDKVQVNKFSCINDKEYFESSPSSTLGSCLQLYEVMSIEIQKIKINYKKGYNNKLIDLQNKLYYENSDIDIKDGEFSNMLLMQNVINSFSSPIAVQSENNLTLKLTNCHFFSNSLEVFKVSQAFSTSAIWIENSLGTVIIKNSSFKNSTSNSRYNFMFIQASQLELYDNTFDNSSFSQSVTQQMGGFMNLKIETLKIFDSSLSKSISKYGSFLYIESLGSLLQIDINNTAFSEGHAEVDGSALYIDVGKSKLLFTCTTCKFDNIYTYSSKSSAIGFEKYRITTQSQIHETIYKGGHVKNIFGVGDNFFTDIQNMKLQFIDIQQITSLVSDSNEVDASIKYQFGKTASQQSTLVGSEYSEINISGCNINHIQILNQDSKLPLLISSDFSTVSFTDSKIYDGIFVRSAIKVTNGTLSFKNTQFKNIVQQKKQLIRQLSVQDQSSDNDIASLIIAIDSSLLTSEGTSFDGTKCYNNCTGAVFHMINTNFDMSSMSITDSEAEFGGAIFIQGLKLLNIIASSVFENNIAHVDGGAIYLQALKDDIFQLKIKDCEMITNNAISGQGGALFIRSKSDNSTNQLIEIQDTKLIGNIAQIGGGIYQKEISPIIKGSTVFKQNVGKTFGNDSLSYPTHLRLASMNQFLSEYKAEKVSNDSIVISNFRSGDTLKYLSFELVNDQEEEIRPITSQELQDYSVKVQVRKNDHFQNYSLKGNVSTFYDNLKSNQFAFKEFDFIGIPGSQSTLEFVSDQIYVLDKNSVNQYNKNYSFKVIINFRDCIQGEAISVYDSLTQCTICNEGKYSYDLKECQTCPSGATCAGGAQMVANQGYWRKNNESTELVSCTQSKFCVGGSFGNHICLEGHIGALCEECDITGEYWGKNYAESNKNSCMDCKDMPYNSYFVILVTLWTLMSMALAIKQDYQTKLESRNLNTINLKKQISFNPNSSQKVQSYLQNSQELQKINLSKKISLIEQSLNKHYNDTQKDQQRTRQLSTFRDKTPSNYQVSSQKHKKNDTDSGKSSIYIKILTNYFQIISSLASFNLNIPSGIFGAPQLAGQPLNITMGSIDCLLKDYETTIPFIYLRQMVSFSIPFAYFLIFFLGLGIQQLKRRKGNFPFYMLSTAAMFLIIYVQPDLVSQLIALVSCRKIGETNYILANVSYECYTSEHQYYAFLFIFPALSIWTLVLPLLLFSLLYKKRNNLYKIKTLMTYGFLYKEYKEKAFYWEFIKMIQKICIILSLNYYFSTVNVKVFLVFVIIVIYGILSIIIQPFEDEHINRLDNYSTTVCALSVLLGLFIYQNPFPYFSFSSLGIIILINVLFIYTILKRIGKAYHEQLKNKLRQLAIKIPLFKKLFKQNLEIKKVNPRVKENVKKVFMKYIGMSAEEKQKTKFRMVKSSFKMTLSNMFGNYDDIQDNSAQQFVDMNSSDKKFTLLNFKEEHNNLFSLNSPIQRPLQKLEESERDEEKNQQKRALLRHSVLSQHFNEEKITDRPQNTEFDETQEFKNDYKRRRSTNYNSQRIKFLNSLNQQKTNEDFFQVNELQKTNSINLSQNFSPILFSVDSSQAKTFYEDEVKTYDEENQDNSRKTQVKFSLKGDSKFETGNTPKLDDYQKNETNTKASEPDLNSNLQKNINLLYSMNDEITCQDDRQSGIKNEGVLIQDKYIN